MDLMNNIHLNLYSIAIATVLFVHNYRHDESGFLKYRLYRISLISMVLLLFLDIFARFDGNPGTYYEVFNHTGNFLLFLLSPAIPTIWLLLVFNQVTEKEKIEKEWLSLIIISNIINLILLALNPFYNIYYFIDSNNIYHRGPLYIVSLLICIILLAKAYTLIIANRRQFSRTQLFSLIFFPISPLLGLIIQFQAFEISLMLNLVVLSQLIILINFQDNNIYRDYLTGVYNRKKLDRYLRDKVNCSNGEKTFSAILIDIDNFKEVNDRFGHDVGDNALQICTKLISSCLRANDLISRFGGDEFFIVLNASEEVELQTIINRINKSVEDFNRSGGEPFALSLSKGYGIYDFNSGMDFEEFKRTIDKRMYENKKQIIKA